MATTGQTAATVYATDGKIATFYDYILLDASGRALLDAAGDALTEAPQYLTFGGKTGATTV